MLLGDRNDRVWGEIHPSSGKKRGGNASSVSEKMQKQIRLLPAHLRVLIPSSHSRTSACSRHCWSISAALPVAETKQKQLKKRRVCSGPQIEGAVYRGGEVEAGV